MHHEAGPGPLYHTRIARKNSEFEAVFRFRYEHFFHCFSDGYPGLDRAGARVFEKHDTTSTHFCAFDSAGRLCAVSTATPATAPDRPEGWNRWLLLDTLAPTGEDNIIVSTRMVVHPEHRGHGLYRQFYRFIMKSYLEAGFRCALHYCSPAFLSRYQNLGHQFYGEAFIMTTGLLRIPMLMDFCDTEILRRVGSPILDLCSAHGCRSAPLRSTLPGLPFQPDFSLLSPEERLEYIWARIGKEKVPAPEQLLPLLEHASPLHLGAGLSHAAPPGGELFCLVLRGAIQDRGADRPAGPGSFVGSGLAGVAGEPSFTVVEDSEVLTFDQKLIQAAIKLGPDPAGHGPWQALHRASLGHYG